MWNTSEGSAPCRARKTLADLKPKKRLSALEEIQQLTKALEAGRYDARPDTLIVPPAVYGAAEKMYEEASQ